MTAAVDLLILEAGKQK